MHLERFKWLLLLCVLIAAEPNLKASHARFDKRLSNKEVRSACVVSSTHFSTHWCKRRFEQKTIEKRIKRKKNKCQTESSILYWVRRTRHDTSRKGFEAIKWSRKGKQQTNASHLCCANFFSRKRKNVRASRCHFSDDYLFVLYFIVTLVLNCHQLRRSYTN